MKARVPRIDPPLALPEYELADAMAWKAIHAGTADEHQQRRAFDWLIRKLCPVGASSHRGEATHDAAVMEGRRIVGIHLLHFVTAPVEALRSGATT